MVFQLRCAAFVRERGETEAESPGKCVSQMDPARRDSERAFRLVYGSCIFRKKALEVGKAVGVLYTSMALSVGGLASKQARVLPGLV